MIKNSFTIVGPKWFSILEDVELGHRMMPQDVSTCWNSTYDMLSFAVEYRVALDIIMGDHEMKLRQYEMDDEEWHIATQLRDILNIFKQATLFFSCNGTLNIARVIPGMDSIDGFLATSVTDSKYSVLIQATLAMGKKTLNHYYSKTDYSEVYRIAMSEYITLLL
jgi:hypothetical protein